MVESSKILTVSYGTFSCTLEGFEDSFSTMKAIAEYFRDLAAGDRYFGAEPPTPDAEMLTRIAEREISRRVEVRSSDTGIVLRAYEPMPQTAAPLRVNAPTAGPTPSPTPTPAPAQSEAAALVAAQFDADDSMSLLQPQAETDVEVDVDVDHTAPDALDEAATDDAPVMPPAPRRPVETDTMREKAIAAARDAEPVEAVAEPTAPRNEVPAHPESESVAAKLQRIRAVVGGVSPAAAASSAFIEDLEETAPVVGAPDQQDTSKATAEQKQDEATFEAPIAEAKADDIVTDDAGAANKAPALTEAETDAAIARDQAVFGGAETAEEAPAAATAVTNQQDVEPAIEADETENQISAVLRNLQRAGLRAPQRDDQTDDSAAAPAETTPAPAEPRGRILRVTRRQRPAEAAETGSTVTAAEPQAESSTAATTSVAAMITAAQNAHQEQNDAPDAKSLTDAFELQTQAETAEEPEDDGFDTSVAALDAAADMTNFDADATNNSLSEDDEADLQRTLAALRVEDVADESTEKSPEADIAWEAAPKLRRDPLPDTSEAEMSRIISQANEELADPEASRRRSAIAHLKAAVAATEAARQLGETGDKRAETEDVFREDLDQVVRPRRAARPEGTPDRSERARPAPLKLVASQRVNLEQDNLESPVKPRRVEITAPVAAEDPSNFADFAENMGATSLQDLLEAAAAYTAFVEGSEDFSRPHIMQKVRQTVAEDFSREDGLRSFGTLLRQGRIERVRNGRFVVSNQTRFKPEAMAAGG
jgi:hypothetical protein